MLSPASPRAARDVVVLHAHVDDFAARPHVVRRRAIQLAICREHLRYLRGAARHRRWVDDHEIVELGAGQGGQPREHVGGYEVMARAIADVMSGRECERALRRIDLRDGGRARGFDRLRLG